MKNLKKVLAVVLALTLLLTMYLPATVSAADSFKYSKEATILHSMGLYAGISSTSFVPDLGSTVTKEMGVTLILRTLGYDSYAKNLTEAQIENMLKIFSDADQISAWARPYVAAGLSLGVVNGNLDFTFTPKADLDAKMLAKLILVNADYTVDQVGYQSAPYLLRDYGALTLEQATYFMSKNPIVRDDLVGMIFNSLKLRFKGTTTSIIGKLVTAGLVPESVALSSGTYNKDIIDAATAAVTAYEAAPYSTYAQVQAGTALKTQAEALIAKFASFPDAATSSIVAIKTSLQNRIAAQLAKVQSAATFDVSANEVSRVTVNFSKEIDPATIGDGVKDTTGLKITVNGEAQAISATSYVASNDNKTLTFAFSKAYAFNSTVSVTTTANLKCKDTSAVTVATKSAVISDNTAPTFATTVGINNKTTLTLTPSEPLTLATSATLYNTLDGTQGIKVLVDGSAAIAIVTPSATGAIKLNFLSEIAKGAHTIVVSGYKDLAGIAGADTTINFTMDYDSVAPVATGATYVNTRRVDFTFGEALTTVSADAFKVNGVAATSYTLSTDKMTVSAILPAAMGSESLFGVKAEVVAGKLADAWGNGVAAASFTVTSNTTDVTAPTATYSYDAAKYALNITFSEPVEFSAATTLSVMNGKVAIATTAVAAGTYTSSVAFDSAALKAAVTGKDSLSLVLVSDQAVTDLSIKKNVLAKEAITYSFTTANEGAPAITSVQKAGNSLFVNFSEAVTNLPGMDTITLTINGAPAVAFKTLAGAAMTSSASQIVLSATDLSGVIATDTLTVPGVKDLAGNAIAVNNSTVTVIAAFASDSVTATATSGNTFVVTLPGSYNYAAAPSANSVRFLKASDDSALTDMVITGIAVSGNKMTITTNKAIKANATVDGTVGVKVQIDANAINTQFGVKAPSQKVAIADGIKATQNALTYSASAVSTYTVAFDESVTTAATDAQLAAGIEVYTTVKLLANIDYTATISGGAIVITLTTPQILTSVKIVRADLLTDTATPANAVIVK